MSGTRVGGLKARDKNRAKDPDFYQKIGAKGGSKKGDELLSPKGFGSSHELAVRAGKQGGLKSRRGIHLAKPNKKERNKQPVTYPQYPPHTDGIKYMDIKR